MTQEYLRPIALSHLLWMAGGVFSFPALAAEPLPTVALAGHALPVAGARATFEAASTGLPCAASTVDGRQGLRCSNSLQGEAEVVVEVAFTGDQIDLFSVRQEMCDTSQYPSAAIDAVIAALGAPVADEREGEGYTQVRRFASGHAVASGGEVDCFFELRHPRATGSLAPQAPGAPAPPSPAPVEIGRYTPGVYPKGSPMFTQVLEQAAYWCSKGGAGRSSCGQVLVAMRRAGPPKSATDASGTKVPCAALTITATGAEMVADCGPAPTIVFERIGRELGVKAVLLSPLEESGAPLGDGGGE